MHLFALLLWMALVIPESAGAYCGSGCDPSGVGTGTYGYDWARRQDELSRQQDLEYRLDRAEEDAARARARAYGGPPERLDLLEKRPGW